MYSTKSDIKGLCAVALAAGKLHALHHNMIWK